MTKTLPAEMIATIDQETQKLTGADKGSVRIGVAISGGADSTFLLNALVQAGYDVCAATVDHALRQGSREEAVNVGKMCETIGIPHEILTWVHPDGEEITNVQADARDARYDLLSRWAKKNDVQFIAVGHNLDDAIENFVIRKRGLPKTRVVDGIVFFRPMLTVSRLAVRETLESIGVEWAEDPSNRNEKFKRVAVRNRLVEDPQTRQKLLDDLFRDDEKRYADISAVHDMLRDHVRVDPKGAVILDASVRTEPQSTIAEALRVILRVTGNKEGRIRGDSLNRAAQAFQDGKSFTLCGALYDPVTSSFTRDPGSAPVQVIDGQGVWDDRWRVETDTKLDIGPHRKGKFTVPKARGSEHIIYEFMLTSEDVMNAFYSRVPDMEQARTPVEEIGPTM